MNRTDKIRFASLAILLAYAINGSAMAQDHIAWRFDLEQAKKVAAEEDKLILLHFGASWCAPCKEIERFVFVNPMAIRAIGGQVVPVKVDVDLHTHIAEEYGVSTVPYDVLITPAGHVVTERTSPRSSDGYLQMIQQAKNGAANLSEKVVRQTSELREEIRRQKQAMADKENQEASYGALAKSDANQFQPGYDAPAGTEVPKFENPKPWSHTNVETIVPDADGIVTNKFVTPSGDFRPALAKVKSPAAKAPPIPGIPESGGGFMPPAQFAGKKAGESSGFDVISVRENPRTAGDQVASSEVARNYVQPARITNPMAQKKSDPVAFNPKPAAQPAKATVTAGKPAVGLEGYCGVTLMEQQKWVKGDKQWGCLHRGRLYLFASKEYCDQFQMSPDMYSPLLGGADPVNYHQQGDLVTGKRKHGVFYGEDGGPTVIVLFSNAENRARFEAEPAEYLRTVRQAMSRVDGDLLLR